MISIQMTGLEEVQKGLKTDEMKAKFSKAVHDSGLFVESAVKSSIAGREAEPRSVDTGRFLNSVNTDNNTEMVSVVGTDVPYATDLEFGTSKRPARSHFRNSFERSREKILEEIKNSVKG